jgi:hypothetical protein
METYPDIRYLPNVFAAVFFIISLISLLLLEEKFVRSDKDHENLKESKKPLMQSQEL